MEGVTFLLLYGHLARERERERERGGGEGEGGRKSEIGRDFVLVL